MSEAARDNHHGRVIGLGLELLRHSMRIATPHPAPASLHVLAPLECQHQYSVPSVMRSSSEGHDAGPRKPPRPGRGSRPARVLPYCCPTGQPPARQHSTKQPSTRQPSARQPSTRRLNPLCPVVVQRRARPARRSNQGGEFSTTQPELCHCVYCMVWAGRRIDLGRRFCV